MWPMPTGVLLYITAKWAITIEIDRLVHRLHQMMQSLTVMGVAEIINDD